MGDSWRHILTYIQVGASNRNKAGGGLCHVKKHHINVPVLQIRGLI